MMYQRELLKRDMDLIGNNVTDEIYPEYMKIEMEWKREIWTDVKREIIANCWRTVKILD